MNTFFEIPGYKKISISSAICTSWVLLCLPLEKLPEVTYASTFITVYIRGIAQGPDDVNALFCY